MPFEDLFNRFMTIDFELTAMFRNQKKILPESHDIITVPAGTTPPPRPVFNLGMCRLQAKDEYFPGQRGGLRVTGDNRRNPGSAGFFATYRGPEAEYGASIEIGPLCNEDVFIIEELFRLKYQ